MVRSLIESSSGIRSVGSRRGYFVVAESAAVVAVIFSLTLAAQPAVAQVLTWNTNTTGAPVDGPGTWNAASTNWYNGSSDAAWASGGTAVFGAAAGTNPYTVTVGGTQIIGGLTFQSQAYTLSGGSLNTTGGTVFATVNATSGGTISSRLIGSGGLTMNGPGTLTLINSNNFTGPTNVNGGELILQSTNNLSSGVLEDAVYVNTGGTIATATYGAFGYGAGVHITSLNILGGTVILGGPKNETAAWPINFQGGTLSSSGASAYLEIGTFANGTTTVTTSAAATTAVISSPVQLNGAAGGNFAVASGTTPTGMDLVISGSIYGGEGITKAGAGLMALSASNTYTGATTVSAGTLQLGTGQSGQDGSINSTSSVADSGTLAFDTAVSQTASFVISGPGNVVKNGPGFLTVGTGGGLASSFSGSVLVSNGTLEANGTANSPNPTATPLGDAQLASRTITVNNGGVLQFNQSNVLGSGLSTIATPLVINNGGLAISTGNNANVLGPLTLSGGTLSGGGGGASGSYLTYILGAGSVTVNTAPSLITVSGSQYPGVNMAATTTFNVGLTGPGGTSANPDLTVAASLGDQPGALQFSGSSAYSASLVKTGPGTMLLASSDSYSGTTLVNNGTLLLGNTGALLMSSFNPSGAGTLSFGTLPGAIFGGLTSSGTLSLTNGAGSAILLLVGANNNNTTFSGTLADAGQGGSLMKVGTGTLTLAGNNTYIGTTLVSSGALAITGSLGNTAVTVASGGTLTSGGSGYIGGSVNVNGGGALTLALANSATSLTVANGLTLGSAGGGYGAGNYATLSYTVSSNGAQPINLGASALTVNSGGAFVNVNFPITPPAGSVYPLINFGSQSLTGSFSLDPSNPNVTSLPLGRDTYNLVDNANSLQLQIIGPPIPGVAYFYGAVSNIWNDLSNSTSSNWSANLAGTQDAGNIPGSTTDVIFSANTQSGSNVATTLGGNFIINSLNVNATASSTTIGNPGETNVLTINALADSNTNSSGYTGNPAGNGISVAVGAGPVTINVPLLLGGSQTWTNSSSSGLTLTNSVSGTAGSGNTQTLTLTNAAAGGTTIGGNIANGTAGGNLAIVINNSGTGTTVFAGSNTYTGGTTINNGTVQVASANGLPSGAGTGNVVLGSTGGAFLDLDGTPMIYINGLVGGGGTSLGQIINSAMGTVATLNFGNGGGSGTFAGVIADNNGLGGQVALVKSGGGTEVLSGSNTYSGGTEINGGVLSLANAAALSSGTIQFGGGTLQFSASNTDDYSASIFNSSGPISLDTNGQTVTFASNLDGSNVGGLTKIGNGSLTLGGDNAYSGATLIRAGSLAVTGTGSLSGSTPYVEVGTTSGSPAALVFGPSSVTNLTTSGGSLTVSYGSTVTIPAGASFTTAGFVKLASLANNVAGGTLNQSGGTVTITGYDSNNRSLTIGEFGGDTGAYNLTGGSLSVPNGIVFLPWNGNGILNISGATASFGELKLGNGANACTSTLNLTNGGALYLGSGGMVATASNTATISLSNGTVGATAPWSSSAPLTLTGAPSGPGGTTFDTTGGNITLTGAISGSGGMTLVGGNTLIFGSGGALASSFSGNIVVSNGTLEANGTANSTNPTATPLGDAQLASRTITVNNGCALLFNQGNVMGGGGSLILTPLVINAGALVSNTQTATNNVLGPIELSGGTLAGYNGGSSGLYLTYQLSAGSVTVDTAPSLMSINGSTNPGFNMAQTTTFNVGLTGTAGTVSSYPDLTVDGNLGDVWGAKQYSGNPAFSATLVKIGAGTMLLGASDSYSGGTIIDAGVLQLGNNYALGSGALAANGGTLDLASYSITVPSFSGAAGVVTTSVGGLATLTVGQSNTTTFGGTISDGAGQLALAMTGAGTLYLSGSNTYTGGTIVTNGELIVSSAEAIDANGAVTNLSVGNDLGAFMGTVMPAAVAGPAAGVGVTPVPEPGSMFLLLTAFTGGLFGFRLRRRKAAGKFRVPSA